MSYIEELRDRIAPELSKKGIKILPKGKSLRLVKDMKIVLTLEDKGDYIEMKYGGKTYKYDKWYTKPEHLAPVVLRLFQ